MKKFWVGISQPWGNEEMCWDVEENIDYLSPDLLSKAKGIEVPLKQIEANSKKEAVEIYKKEVAQVASWKLKNCYGEVMK